MGESRELLLRPSIKGQLPSLGLLIVFLAFEVFIALRGLLAPWLAIACPAVFVVALALSGVSLVRTRGKPWQLRCGPDGVEARGFATVPWPALAEVRISRLKPRWLFFPAPAPGRVVAFVPRDRATVPAIAVFDAMSRRSTTSNRFAQSHAKRYGSSFVVFTNTVDASPEEIAAAIRALTDVPVVVG
ncbi:hypothetical protein [Amycolatopsis sp. WQ 127309]|uniref:hypothetical protein n=1 Tax=Amycolatopsis sp. WQ 127309 TaxID=2932773 RepID=UPI001FF2ECA3|nr:hypothetical protein [Amycolatopsis sp. WQ 127309]UOZ03067.1 hypothetical protein MUY22_29925 [Amycolatopsis sp. WQ 127309]